MEGELLSLLENYLQKHEQRVVLNVQTSDQHHKDHFHDH